MFSRLYGNSETKTFLQNALAQNRLSHAYLIEGEAQSGKHTLALSIAAALAGKEMQARVWEGKCPDVITMGLSPERKTISVDLVRTIKQSVYLKPSELSCKVYIIEQADALTPQAQNALLILLEEPPPQVYFLLLCQNASSLLPTVRSRTQLLRTERFSQQALAALLLEHEETAGAFASKDADAWHRLLTQANGNYGKACTLLRGKTDTKGKKKSEKIQEILADLAQKNAPSVLRATARFAVAREDMIAELDLFLSACRDILCLKHGVESATFFANLADAQQLCNTFTQKAISDFYEGAIQAKEALMANANVALTQTVLAYALADAVQCGM